MRTKILCRLAALLLASSLPAQYRIALPGYHYRFPDDNFNHPDFKTEWWYYTGNVKSADNHRLGFELTFFRVAVERDPAKNNPWDLHDLYLAQLALSDLDGGHFYHTERTNRAGPGLAGASENDGCIWNGNWRIRWTGNDQSLDAIADNFELHFNLHSAKSPVIHGENGISRKGSGPGRASHYISLTRLETVGRIRVDMRNLDVSGLAWMDHEFFSSQLEPGQVGWDWISIQLNDSTELMLFRIRRKDGSIDPHTSGTFVDAKGVATFLPVTDFEMQPASDTWTSSATHATYPVGWKIHIRNPNIELEARTPLPSQELTGASKLIPTYWEGAIELAGHKGAQPIAGVGYLEMTGYDRAFDLSHE
jgi:predicted secreted hydrolase